MATLILLMGLPASGKTSYSKKLTGININLEQLRFGVTGSHQEQGNFNELVQQLAQRSVHFYLNENKTVIVDALFLKVSERKSYIKIAKKLNMKVELYWFDPSIETIKNRLTHAGNEMLLATIDPLARQLDFPNKEEGFDVIHYISEN